MIVTPTPIPEVLLVEPKIFRDHRGYFYESWNETRAQACGLPSQFVQDNISYSSAKVLRGLHYQHPRGQGKLVSVLQGEVFDVAVDVRRGAPTFGRWVGYHLSAENHRQLYIPPGFAHGFCVISNGAVFSYKCTDYYHPGGEFTIRFDDPAIGVRWPIADPVLSAKDAAGFFLADLADEQLPQILRHAA